MRILLAAVLIVPIAASARPMVPADLNALAEISDPALSPDGKDIAYVVTTTNAADDKTESHIWLAHWDGAKENQLTGRTGESETHPRYTQDGKYLLFLSSRTDPHHHDQLWRLPRAGGEAEKLTDLPGGIDDFSIAPNGARVAVVAPDPDPAETAKTPRPIVIDRYRFKQDIDGYLTARRQRIYLMDLTARTPSRLTSGEFDEFMPVFSPDGQTIAFISKRQADPDRSYNFNLYVTQAHPASTPRQLSTWPGANNDPDWDSPPSFSPDGKKIAYLQGRPPQLMAYGVRRLAIAPTAGGKVELTEPELDRNISHPMWSADGNSISALFEDDGVVRLFYFDLPQSLPVAVTQDRGVILSYTQAAGHTAVVATTPMHPAEIFAQEGPWLRRLTTHNRALVTGLDFGEVSRTVFHSRDGTEIHGFVVTPPGAKPGQKLPTILRLHGGPQLEYEMAFRADWQILAGHGYQVVAANPRGSIGRGQEFSSAIYADWGHKDAEDVLAAVDDAVAHHNADPARLGIGGWSYGGILTDDVIAQDRRFRAAIAGAGIGNILAGYGTDEYALDYETELGTPWANLATWERLSFPFLHNDRIVTPTLFLCGEKDFNVPCLNSEQMYQGLRSRGVPAELVIYPDSFHELQRPSFIVDRMQRYLAWYDRFVTGAAALPAVK